MNLKFAPWLRLKEGPLKYRFFIPDMEDTLSVTLAK